MFSLFRKTWILAAAFALAAHSLHAQTSSNPELMALLLAFKAKMTADAQVPFAKSLDELNQNYVQALDRAQHEATVKGKLEEALAIRAEKTAVSTSNGEQLPALVPQHRELAALRKKYLDALQTLRSAMQKKLEPLEKDLASQLDVLALKMLNAGKSDVALEARQLAKTYRKTPGVTDNTWEDQTRKVVPKPTTTPIRLKKRDTLSTAASFTPPIEFEMVVKIESLDLRIGYAAKEMIFNWERKPDELRIDGGPADRVYTPKMGEIPQNKFVVIQWTVLKDRQIISVDGKERFEHKGDYSDLNRPLTIQAFGSEGAVQSIKTRVPVIH
ncbi:hypothetical protein [Prosthecobacter sp.]|uniref:hypothetical protein n=1 Tax=Prosthecobacter sp. TaxID=1965333 RepID=UPI003783996E